MRFKKGDQIKVISGNDKGKQGKVLAAFPREGKIVVEGVNMKKKHVRPKQAGKKGELIRIPAPFPVSRVMLVCPKCGKTVRARYEIPNGGNKLRLCKECGGEI